MQQEAFHIHAITCRFTKPNLIINNCGFGLISVQVSFWNNSTTTVEPLLTIDVFIPAHWSIERFLDEFEESVNHCGIISLFNSYIIDRILLPYNMINSLHEKLKTKKNKRK
jgi:hypothetical protein